MVIISYNFYKVSQDLPRVTPPSPEEVTMTPPRPVGVTRMVTNQLNLPTPTKENTHKPPPITPPTTHVATTIQTPIAPTPQKEEILTPTKDGNHFLGTKEDERKRMEDDRDGVESSEDDKIRKKMIPGRHPAIEVIKGWSPPRIVQGWSPPRTLGDPPSGEVKHPENQEVPERLSSRANDIRIKKTHNKNTGSNAVEIRRPPCVTVHGTRLTDIQSSRKINVKKITTNDRKLS